LWAAQFALVIRDSKHVVVRSVVVIGVVVKRVLVIVAAANGTKQGCGNHAK